MLALALLVLATPSATVGDFDVQGETGSDFTPDAWAKVLTAKTYLSVLDPAGAAELEAAIVSGQLKLCECNANGFNGLTDGNTIQVKTTGQPAHVVAARIAHEYMHWKYGTDGALGPCEHAAVWIQTLMLQSWSGIEGHPFPCSFVQNVKQQYNRFLLQCPGGQPIDPATGQAFSFPVSGINPNCS